MYEKNLEKSFRFRMSSDDFDFLLYLSDVRSCSVGAVVRQLIGESRRKDSGYVQWRQKNLSQALVIIQKLS